MHHLPTTGDLPNTVFPTARSGIQAMPSNYFTTDQSRQTVNMVRIDYGNGTTALVHTFGQRDDQAGALEFERVEYGYKGDVCGSEVSLRLLTIRITRPTRSYSRRVLYCGTLALRATSTAQTQRS